MYQTIEIPHERGTDHYRIWRNALSLAVLAGLSTATVGSALVFGSIFEWNTKSAPCKFKDNAFEVAKCALEEPNIRSGTAIGAAISGGIGFFSGLAYGLKTGYSRNEPADPILGCVPLAICCIATSSNN